MNDPTTRAPVLDPQDLERLLVARQHAGDVEGMVALFEAEAVVDCGGGRFLRGRAAIRAFYVELVASDLPEEITGEDFLRRYSGTADAVTRVDPARTFSPTRRFVLASTTCSAFR